MANYHGSLEAVDYHIHSLRYDIAVNKGADGHLTIMCLMTDDNLQQGSLMLSFKVHHIGISCSSQH
eukprot:scaffold36601_cov88-Skeletonema_marinoi.AAC.1